MSRSWFVTLFFVIHNVDETIDWNGVEAIFAGL